MASNPHNAVFGVAGRWSWTCGELTTAASSAVYDHNARRNFKWQTCVRRAHLVDSLQGWECNPFNEYKLKHTVQAAPPHTSTQTLQLNRQLDTSAIVPRSNLFRHGRFLLKGA